MTTVAEELETKVEAAKVASRDLARLSTDVKNRALLNVATRLNTQIQKALTENNVTVTGCLRQKSSLFIE